MFEIPYQQIRYDVLNALFPSWIAELSNVQIFMGTIFVLILISLAACFIGKITRKLIPRGFGAAFSFLIICAFLLQVGS